MNGVLVQRCAMLPERFDELVRAGGDEGFTFVPRLEHEWQSGVNRFDAPGEAFLCARVDARLVGVGGLNIDPFAGDPRVGRIRHLYVLPECRGHGVGTKLVHEIIALARPHFARLRLRTQQAAAFYERLGFERRDDPDATHVVDLVQRHE